MSQNTNHSEKSSAGPSVRGRRRGMPGTYEIHPSVFVQGGGAEPVDPDAITPAPPLDQRQEEEGEIVEGGENIPALPVEGDREEPPASNESTLATGPDKGKGKSVQFAEHDKTISSGRRGAAELDEITPAPPQNVPTSRVDEGEGVVGATQSRSANRSVERPHPMPASVDPSDVVYLNESGPRGQGVFSRYPVQHGLTIFAEAPLLVCREVELLNEHGFSHAWETAVPTARQQLKAMFPQLQRVPNLLVGYPETQQMLETFLRDRAFKAMKVGSTGATCVVGGYASFVNHACPGDITQINARVNPIASVAPRFVLKATRDIRPGEEIFIDYGKPLGFRCCCRVCEDIRSNKFGGRLRLWMKYQWEKQRWCRQWKRGKSMQTVWSY